MNYIEKLARLMSENPELPVICMGEDYMEFGLLSGSGIGDSCVGECAIYKGNVYTDRVEFMDAYYEEREEELNDRFGFSPEIVANPDKFTDDEIEANEYADENLNEYLNDILDMAFKPAIIVEIVSVIQIMDFADEWKEL